MRPDSARVARFVPSPNHSERAAGKTIDCLILHYTGMPSADAALRRLCDQRAQVSSHYFVGEDGEVLQLVPEERRAWHAGQSWWAGETDINSCSLGIEIANGGHPGGLPPFPEVQIEAVVALCRDLCTRHAIAPQRVLAHSDIAPRRKIDPGENFPWDMLHRAGVGHWVPPAGAAGVGLRRGEGGGAVEALQRALANYGYEIAATGSFDEATEFVIAAFQRHFRPMRVDGIADAATLATLHDLVRALPARGYGASAEMNSGSGRSCETR